MRGVWWGWHPNTLITVYKFLIRPRMDYVSFVYFPNAKHLINKLEFVQTRAIKLASGLRMSSPNSVTLSRIWGTETLKSLKFLLLNYEIKKISSNMYEIENWIREKVWLRLIKKKGLREFRNRNCFHHYEQNLIHFPTRSLKHINFCWKSCKCTFCTKIIIFYIGLCWK